MPRKDRPIQHVPRGSPQRSDEAFLQLLLEIGVFISNPKNLYPYFGLKTFELLDDSSIFN